MTMGWSPDGPTSYAKTTEPSGAVWIIVRHNKLLACHLRLAIKTEGNSRTTPGLIENSRKVEGKGSSKCGPIKKIPGSELITT